MVIFTLIINDAPYNKERAYTALRFARTAVFEGHTTRIFLIENGVYVAKKDQKPAADQPNFGVFLEDLIKDGQEVKACIVCIKARGIAESELLSGVKVAALNDLVEWTATSDKVIVF